MVLTQIHNKIKAIARIPGNEKSLWYLVPEFLPGTPRFDIGEAIVYIVWNLRNTGYEVHYTHPNLLFISWRAYDERYKVAESPWSQVLKSARETVLTTPTPSLISYVTRSQPITAPTPEIIKRKTPLKKTVEFKPTADIIPTHSTNPTVVSAMYASGGAIAMPQLRLPGQLGEKHISFV